MKIALVGTGRMGSAVEALAAERGHRIAARFNSARPLAAARGMDDFGGAAVAIDFSLPHLMPAHLERYCMWRQPAVIGTTGWYDRLPALRRRAREGGASLLYAPNFSLGIAVLVAALRAVGPLVDRLGEFDVAVHETHHTGKVDRPSGTALLLAAELVRAMAGKTRLETQSPAAMVDAEALQVTSSRVGSVFGEHEVTVDGAFDSIFLGHRAKSRTGFALGALKAAEWLPGRVGLFTLDDVLGAVGNRQTNRVRS